MNRLAISDEYRAWLRSLRGDVALERFSLILEIKTSKSTWNRWESTAPYIPALAYLEIARRYPNGPQLSHDALPHPISSQARTLPALMQWLAGMPADAALALLDDAGQEIDRQRAAMRVAPCVTAPNTNKEAA